VLSLVVLIHELGHFTAARSFGIKVDSLNVGVGPKLLSTTNSEGIEFALRALPIGGYVAFPPNFDLDVVMKNEKEAFERTGEFDVDVDYFDDEDLLQNRPVFERAVVFSGGIIANVLLSLSIYAVAVSPMGPGLKNSVFDDCLIVTSVGDAEGLRRLDVIKSVNGKGGINSDRDMLNALSNSQIFQLTVLRSPPPPQLDILGEGEEVPLQLPRQVSRVDAESLYHSTRRDHPFPVCKTKHRIASFQHIFGYFVSSPKIDTTRR